VELADSFIEIDGVRKSVFAIGVIFRQSELQRDSGLLISTRFNPQPFDLDACGGPCC
jgi:hypothetical protein